MEELRHWALLLCVASVLGGIVQMLLPEKEQSTGIKLVLGLYIVVTALTPAANIRWDLLAEQPWQTMQAADTSADYSGWVVQYSQETLQRQLQAQLEQQVPGTVVRDVLLEYDAQSGFCEVRQVALETQGQREAAQLAVKKLLGEHINVEFMQGDEKDGPVQME